MRFLQWGKFNKACVKELIIMKTFVNTGEIKQVFG